MDTLLDELLLEIFLHLPVPDLLSASLVCQKFNLIISSSLKLVENFEIQFTSKNVNNEWIGSRNYTSCFIEGESCINYFYILKSIGPKISNLVVNCCDMQLEVLKQVLLMCENVKNLTVYNVAADGADEVYGPPNIKLDLDYFHFTGITDGFKLFTSSSTKILDARRYDCHEYVEVTGVKEFLKNQANLVELKLENFYEDSSLFKDDFLTSVNFHLKRLKLKNVDGNAIDFWEFLELHKDSLIDLEAWTVGHEILSIFRKFKNLKSLKLCSMCSDYSQMSSVETLYLKDVHGNWSEKLPNVKNLVISQDVVNIQQVENLKHLENLKISNCSVPILKIPTVKKLILNRVELDENMPFDYENGSSIEDMRICKMKNLEWLIEFLINKTFNLKSLVIQKSIISQEDVDFIDGFRNRLKKLEILDCFGLTDEDIDDDEDFWDEDFSASSDEENDEDGNDGSEHDDSETDENSESEEEENAEESGSENGPHVHFADESHSEAENGENNRRN